MEIMRDYVPAVKLPIIAIIALFIIQTVLVLFIDLFTQLEQDPEIYTLILGGIYFALIIAVWEIIAWAGIRTARATQGGMIDGAIGGAMTAVIAGIITRIIGIVFQISILPLADAATPSSAAAIWITSVLGILLSVGGLIIWFFLDLIGGAILGALGGIVHNRKLIDQMDRY
jgi:hypothetical protein